MILHLTGVVKFWISCELVVIRGTKSKCQLFNIELSFDACNQSISLVGDQITVSPPVSPVMRNYFDPGSADDGTSSDLALQYLIRYAAGNVVDVLNVTSSNLPSAIRKLLNSVGLEFQELNEFLQRALIWDSGYVVSSANATEFVRTYTNYNRSMAKIALPVNEMMSPGCTIKKCSDANGGSSEIKS